MFPRLLGVCAFVSALALAIMPLPVALGVVAAAIIVYGGCKAKHDAIALVPTVLAVGGILMLVFAITPASAAEIGRVPLLTTLSLPAPSQALTLAAPSAPQTIVIAAADQAKVVSIPVSEWLADARNSVEIVLLAILGFALRRAPAPLVWLVKMYGERKLVEMAVNVGINAVKGATKGEVLSVDVGSKVLATSLQWAVNEVPGIILKAFGGEEALRTKIFAALHLEDEASAIKMGVSTTA